MHANDLLCFSHLRWNFVFQRPNHLMVRCARERRVLYIEEPMFDASRAELEVLQIGPNLWRLVPHLPAQPADLEQPADDEAESMVRSMLESACDALGVQRAIHWFYTPMMLPLAERLAPSLTVYDCMDELSHFAFAPPALKQREQELLAKADVVFTGGRALYEVKRSQHDNVHAMPSSVDAAFFAQAREAQALPADLESIPEPRIGYCGVLDERLDWELVERLARELPGLQFVYVGPFAKVDEDAVPRLPNIHYLGARNYQELPRYLAGCKVAMMPFAYNDATRYISPTKTPEYLAAGLPVVSTAIADVVEPYERLGLVSIGREPTSFIAHVERWAAREASIDLSAVDAFLASQSWDDTWASMRALMAEAVGPRRSAVPAPSSLSEVQHV